MFEWLEKFSADDGDDADISLTQRGGGWFSADFGDDADISLTQRGGGWFPADDGDYADIIKHRDEEQ